MWVWWRSPGRLSGGVSDVLGRVGWRLALPCRLRDGWGGWRAAWRDPCRSGQTVGVAGRSAAQRQGPQPSERTGELDGPRPGGLQPQDQAAGVTDDPGGDVQEPVAQRLGLGDRQRTV